MFPRRCHPGNTGPVTPDSIERDTKDWTWVLSRPCVECGFDAAAVVPSAVHDVIRRDAADRVDRLRRPGVAGLTCGRPWSTAAMSAMSTESSPSECA